jgi:Spy/CpxP family protein refolding chaperone
MNMKLLRTLIGVVLLFMPLAAWAQNDSPEPPPPDPGETSAGPIIAGQTQPDLPPPPPVGVIQRRVIGGGGPGNATYMTTGGPGPGMGLGAWWKNSEIVSKLQLSDEQVKKISQTFMDHKLKLIDLQADLDKQELRLQPLMDADHPDESKVGAQIDMITAARGRLEKENAMLMLAIRSQLAVEQWKKLKSMEAAEEGKQRFLFWRSGPGINMEGLPPFPGDLPSTAPLPPR